MERERIEKQLSALKEVSDAEISPTQIAELEEKLRELNALIDRIDIAVALEREKDA